MRAAHSRVRRVLPWALLAVLLAVLAGPAGRLADGLGGSDGTSAAAKHVAVLPTVLHSTALQGRTDPDSSTPLPLASLSASLLLVIGLAWVERGRGLLPSRCRRPAALRSGRGPPADVRSLAAAGV